MYEEIPMKPLGIAAVMGLAVVLLIWGLRGYLQRRYERDRAWIEQTALRFSPNPVDARGWTIAYYTTFCLLLVLMVSFLASPILAVVLWLALLAFPRLIVEWLWQARRRKIDLQLPAAVSSMSNSIRAGLTVVQAIERIAETAPEPIRMDFQVMANRYAYGASMDATLNEAKERLASPNFNLFASALLLNREMGGDISDTLTRISLSLDKLHQMRQTVEAHTSEGRTNIKVLLVAPVLILLMLSAGDPVGVTMLFTTSQGYIILLIAGALIAIGVYFAAKITRTDI
jgi:tight adherence protein B